VETEKVRVLLVDDDQGDFEMIRVMLSKAEHQEFQLDWVSNFDEAMDAFELGEHDVYFLDYFLEDRTGLDLLREARNRGIKAPIIMLTGRGSRTVDMEAMDLGASDYLVKGLIDPDALERSIRHAMERAEGAEAIKELGSVDRTERAVAGSPSGGGVPQGHTGAEARFRVVFESTRSGVALVGLDGMLIEVNSAFSEMFSPHPRWSEGMSYLDLLDEGDKEAVLVELKALAKGERVRFEAARRFMNKDGAVSWAHTTTALVRGDDGAPNHLVVVVEAAGAQSGPGG